MDADGLNAGLADTRDAPTTANGTANRTPDDGKWDGE
jgi:hypothetical protein